MGNKTLLGRILAWGAAACLGAVVVLAPSKAQAIFWSLPQGDDTNIYIDTGTEYASHTWLSSGTFTVPPGVTSIQYFVVGGGGGGGRGTGPALEPVGGGGGAGGRLTGTLAVTPLDVYAITVGAGGLGATTAGASGANGGNSSIGVAVVAIGGGGGGGGLGTTVNVGNVGGSGGGRGMGGAGATGAAGTVGQGNAGGGGASNTNFIGTFRGAGGGGGAGGVGGTGTAGGTTPNGGVGGLGVSNTFRDGTPIFYAGGGGGASNSQLGGSGGAGGSGVGGAGASIPNAPGIDAPIANRGGGGGGGRSPRGGNGASGIVIIRYDIDTILRVDLLSFTASSTGPGAPVLIEWETASEVDNAGFNIYRSNNGVPGERLNPFPIPAQGGEEIGSVYSFLDTTPLAAGEVRSYFLEDVELNGNATLHGPVTTSLPGNSDSRVVQWSLYD
jgi:hypothetical protein